MLHSEQNNQQTLKLLKLQSKVAACNLIVHSYKEPYLVLAITAFQTGETESYHLFP